MASQAEQALAFVARREGRGAMPESRWAHVLSLELGWLSPAQARQFVAAAREAGLLQPDGEELQAEFDWKRVEVPRRFRLDPEAYVGPPAPAPTRKTSAPSGAKGSNDPFIALLDEIAEGKACSRGDALQQVTGWQERLGGDVSAEAAALLVAAEAGLDVRDRARAALGRLVEK